MFNCPGHMIGIVAYDDNALAVFNFRSPWIDYDYHDLNAQKEILSDAIAGQDEWKMPELLTAALNDPIVLPRTGKLRPVGLVCTLPVRRNTLDAGPW
jgi:hypothetical protein